MTPMLVLATIAAMIYTLTGCIAFIITYRPVWPWSHEVYGRNLLLLCWWLGLWVGVALLNVAIDMPLELAAGVQLVSFIGVGTVVWRRVFLVPRARRELERRRREGR